MCDETEAETEQKKPYVHKDIKRGKWDTNTNHS